jgi:transposase
MCNKYYTEMFKIKLMEQIIEWHYPVIKVPVRLSVLEHSPYDWGQKYCQSERMHIETQSQQPGLGHLKAELKRASEARDILKKVSAYSAKEPHLIARSSSILD